MIFTILRLCFKPFLVRSSVQWTAVDPWDLLAKLSRGGARAFRVEPSHLPRLRDAVDGLSGPPEITLQASSEGPGRMRLSAALEVQATLTCQRCLQAFEARIEGSFELGIRAPGAVPGDRDDDAAGSLDEARCEPGDSIDLRELIEDEMLLALPFAPRCGRAECEAREDLKGDPPGLHGLHGAGEGDREARVRDNPFAALKELMSTDGEHRSDNDDVRADDPDFTQE